MPATDAIAIRPARDDDDEAIWEILRPVLRAGETYAIDPDIAREDAIAYWRGPGRHAFVAVESMQEAGGEGAGGEGGAPRSEPGDEPSDGEILGVYYIKANSAGGGAHVCNCGYVTAASARGRGVARRMAEHSFTTAVALGFRAMQYNAVVATNVGAVRLWRSLGFWIVGTLPGAFAHPVHGDVDAYVMFRRLTP